jgi:DNA modification methylase
VIVKLATNDCLVTMAAMEPDSVDAVVTDPPYGLEFMGKEWDRLWDSREARDSKTEYVGSDGVKRSKTSAFSANAPTPTYKGGMAAQLWHQEWATAALRVLKPAHYLVAFGGTRTHHRLMVALEDAGFEIRDCLMWLYGCLSEDTEVLTKDGWEQFHRARTGEILVYDSEADIYSWERPSRWSTYRVESDTAYRIESDTTDQIVSRNHRCLVERDGKLTFVAAEECVAVERVPTLPDDFLGIPQTRETVLFPSMQRSLSGPGVGGPRPQGSSGLDGTEQSQLQREDEWREQPCMEGWRDLLQEEGQLCRPVDQICAMPASVHADGEEGWLRHGASSARGDGVGATTATVGGCASRQPRCDGQPARESSVVCLERGSQAARTRPSYRTTLATVTPIEYSGLIFCPTVSTGAFVARRNGKIFITGNSGFPKGRGQLKPAYEPIILCRKPGKGVRPLGIDDCRIGTGGDKITGGCAGTNALHEGGITVRAEVDQSVGRWPANIVLEEGEAADLLDAQSGEKKGSFVRNRTDGARPFNNDGKPTGYETVDSVTDDSPGGASRFFLKVPVENEESHSGRWPANIILEEGEATDLLDAQSGILTSGTGAKKKATAAGHQGTVYGAENRPEGTPNIEYGDTGGASRFFLNVPVEDEDTTRFFYCAKPGKKEKNAGCEGIEAKVKDAEYRQPTGDPLVDRIHGCGVKATNHHPTVKPIALMRWLVRLITPEDGIVLDLFMGSGTTGVACIQENRGFIGIEREPDYVEIAIRRLAHAKKNLVVTEEELVGCEDMTCVEGAEDGSELLV